ncbi:unnamed protein product [Protopolystoma xenopodis]|uniref:Uncharacterized protein n=1 Tax=Protopolystoma xenopodis TaxID=117903 RepID=A0A448XGN8_9PLAT|nr:unnamed protein product [Protopolystoma xenopodis]
MPRLVLCSSSTYPHCGPANFCLQTLLRSTRKEEEFLPLESRNASKANVHNDSESCIFTQAASSIEVALIRILY